MFVPRENPQEPPSPRMDFKTACWGWGEGNGTGVICSGLIVACQVIDLSAEKNHTLFFVA